MAEFKLNSTSKSEVPTVTDTLSDFAFKQAQEFIDMGHSAREATSIMANILVRIAWSVAGCGAVADGAEPNKDNFREVVEEALERVSFGKVDDAR